jgi:ectoine hydroxylase-related dioxygenase (phytanoyl-CoA dioxygenase family)
LSRSAKGVFAMLTPIAGFSDEVAAIVFMAEDIVGAPLTDIHKHYQPELAQKLRKELSPAVRSLICRVCHAVGYDDYVQAAPNIRIHLPKAPTEVYWHSDFLLGHSEFERNFWLPLTPCEGSNSLWIAPSCETDRLHALLTDGASLSEFQREAMSLAKPIESKGPALFQFCCRDIHGSVPNRTPHTRVSFDVRSLPTGVREGVKRRGSYFRPSWLLAVSKTPDDLLGKSVTTVATLDYGCPVYLQRRVMQEFFPQKGDGRELVEFCGLKHAPTLDGAIASGPVIAYTARQMKQPPPTLPFPIGFADEKTWIVPGQEKVLARMVAEFVGNDVDSFQR